MPQSVKYIGHYHVLTVSRLANSLGFHVVDSWHVMLMLAPQALLSLPLTCMMNVHPPSASIQVCFHPLSNEGLFLPQWTSTARGNKLHLHSPCTPSPKVVVICQRNSDQMHSRHLHPDSWDHVDVPGCFWPAEGHNHVYLLGPTPEANINYAFIIVTGY